MGRQLERFLQLHALAQSGGHLIGRLRKLLKLARGGEFQPRGKIPAADPRDVLA